MNELIDMKTQLYITFFKENSNFIQKRMNFVQKVNPIIESSGLIDKDV